MAVKKNTDFNNLWKLIHKVTTEEGDPKLAAIFSNHSDKREYICRKFGIMSLPDVERFRKQIQNRKNFRSV